MERNANSRTELAGNVTTSNLKVSKLANRENRTYNTSPLPAPIQRIGFNARTVQILFEFVGALDVSHKRVKQK